MEGLKERPITYLREGINIKDILSENGVTFEVDADFANNSEDEGNDYFENEPNMEDIYLGMPENGTRNKPDWLSMSFQELAKEFVPLSSDNGVLKKVVKPGYGSVIPTKSRVTCHYNAFFEKQGEPFDSTRMRDVPLRFTLGKGEVVPGFDMAVCSMKQGEVSEFIVDSVYAYGDMGCPPRIQPNASVFYAIEVITFFESEDLLEENDNLTTEEGNKVHFRKVMSTAKSEHVLGGERYNEKNYHAAKQSYRRALRMLEYLNLANEDEERENLKLKTKLHLNLAQCNLFLKELGIAAFHCKRVLELDHKNVKALYRCGKALRIMGEFEEADSYLRRAKMLEPHDPLINQEMMLNDKDFKSYLNREKNFCKKMFGNSQELPKEVKFDIPDIVKNSIRSTIEKFVEDKNSQEHPCRCGFSELELKFVAHTAQEFGLKCVYPNDCDTKLKLVKP